MSLPYFNMYPTDFEAKTSHLTMEEDGAYNRLLRLCWMLPGCSLPDDDAWIMRRMRVDKDTYERVVRVVLDEFFVRENGRVSNARLTQEFQKSQAAHDKRVSAGSKGGKAKSLKNNELATSNARAMPKQPEPEPEPLKKETKVSQKRGSRLPDDWTPSEKNISDAQAQGLTTDEVRHEADKFRDYWISTPGAKGVKLDWDATWRNWCRNASKRTAPKSGRGSGGQSMADALAELRNDIERAERGCGPFSEEPNFHDGATIIELAPAGRGNGHGPEAGQQNRYGDDFGADWVLPGKGFR